MSASVTRSKSRRCFNPFSKPDHNIRNVADLRPLSKENVEKLSSFEIPNNALVCSVCRKELKDYKELDQQSTELQSSGSSFGANLLSQEYCSQGVDKESLKTKLVVLGRSPPDVKRLRTESYATDKYNQAKKCLKTSFEKVRGKEFRTVEEQALQNYNEMLDNMITKFHAPDTSRAQKVQVLSFLPHDFNAHKICQVFGATRHIATVAVQLREERGILAIPRARAGLSLPDATISLIRSFYENDDYSRLLPGKKDCISIRTEDGTRETVQKRLCLNNLKELYGQFKKTYPDYKVGLSKFAELRPKHCILAGGTGTHTVCVCTHHQNVKLMLDGLNVSVITMNWENPISGRHAYKILLQRIICLEPHVDCYDQRCKSCPGTKDLETDLIEELENRLIDTVTYKQWITTDRCTIEKLVKSADEFVSTLCTMLKKLLSHDYIAKQQNEYLTELKLNLKTGEFIATLDFSENYAFVVQEAAQAFHWSNNQATVHPMVVYYRTAECEEVQHITFVGISECLTHDTTAVYMFQKYLIDSLKQRFTQVHKIFYFTDGAPQQYKNKKNFVNLLHHYRDFQVQAEWHFFATAHGKGACDGIGGTVKRLASRACLQFGSDRHILTPKDLFNWASENLNNLNFFFCTNEDYASSAIYLQDRFANAKTIPGTQRFHSFLPCDDNCSLVVKRFSKCDISLRKNIVF